MVHEVCCTFFKIVSDFLEAEFLTSVKNKMLGVVPIITGYHCATVCITVQAPRSSVQVLSGL